MDQDEENDLEYENESTYDLLTEFGITIGTECYVNGSKMPVVIEDISVNNHRDNCIDYLPLITIRCSDGEEFTYSMDNIRSKIVPVRFSDDYYQKFIEEEQSFFPIGALFRSTFTEWTEYGRGAAEGSIYPSIFLKTDPPFNANMSLYHIGLHKDNFNAIVDSNFVILSPMHYCGIAANQAMYGFVVLSIDTSLRCFYRYYASDIDLIKRFRLN